PAAFPAEVLPRMATTEAAAALGIAHLVGSLETGKRADVIAVDRRVPHLLPWHDPVANIVYAARPSDVSAVFVDGRPLVLDRRPVGLDAERILADGTQAARVFAPLPAGGAGERGWGAGGGSRAPAAGPRSPIAVGATTASRLNLPSAASMPFTPALWSIASAWL